MIPYYVIPVFPFTNRIGMTTGRARVTCAASSSDSFLLSECALVRIQAYISLLATVVSCLLLSSGKMFIYFMQTTILKIIRLRKVYHQPILQDLAFRGVILV
jgi:hypothetical protein